MPGQPFQPFDLHIGHGTPSLPGNRSVPVYSYPCRSRLSDTSAAVIEDGAGGGGADAGDAGGAGVEQGVEGADAAGGLDLDLGRAMLAHQVQVAEGGPARAEAGRGLGPVGPHLAADGAEADLVFPLEVTVFEITTARRERLAGIRDQR